MPKLTKARAFKIVYDELSKVDMFMGKFDAKNGNDKFMSGVQTVMEAIAYGVSEDMQWAYTDIFLANWLNSKEKEGEPQYDAEDQFCIEQNCPHFYQFGGCMKFQGDCPYDEDEPQDECAKEYEYLGLKELREMRQTERNE